MKVRKQFNHVIEVKKNDKSLPLIPYQGIIVKIIHEQEGNIKIGNIFTASLNKIIPVINSLTDRKRISLPSFFFISLGIPREGVRE